MWFVYTAAIIGFEDDLIVASESDDAIPLVVEVVERSLDVIVHMSVTFNATDTTGMFKCNDRSTGLIHLYPTADESYCFNSSMISLTGNDTQTISLPIADDQIADGNKTCIGQLVLSNSHLYPNLLIRDTVTIVIMDNGEYVKG
jgi:hypothetical protein